MMFQLGRAHDETLVQRICIGRQFLCIVDVLACLCAARPARDSTLPACHSTLFPVPSGPCLLALLLVSELNQVVIGVADRALAMWTGEFEIGRQGYNSLLNSGPAES